MICFWILIKFVCSLINYLPYDMKEIERQLAEVGKFNCFHYEVDMESRSELANNRWIFCRTKNVRFSTLVGKVTFSLNRNKLVSHSN